MNNHNLTEYHCTIVVENLLLLKLAILDIVLIAVIWTLLDMVIQAEFIKLIEALKWKKLVMKVPYN